KLCRTKLGLQNDRRRERLPAAPFVFSPGRSHSLEYSSRKRMPPGATETLLSLANQCTELPLAESIRSSSAQETRGSNSPMMNRRDLLKASLGAKPLLA